MPASERFETGQQIPMADVGTAVHDHDRRTVIADAKLVNVQRDVAEVDQEFRRHLASMSVVRAPPPVRHDGQMSEEHHSRVVDGRRHTYLTQRLWRLSADLPVIEVPINEIAAFEQDCWFHGSEVTCRMVAEHTRRIVAADLTHPVILAADGSLMDGGHRIARAWLEGRTSIAAVRFVTDPEPDGVADLAPEER